MKTRVYAIKETDDVHEISNEDFIDQAENLGYVWSLLGFQNLLNYEGNVTQSHNFMRLINSELHFRFIGLEDIPQEYK